MTVLDPPDICPECDPGTVPAAVPVGPVTDAGGGMRADYQCGDCGTAWTAVFDVHGWPVERSTAIVKDAATRRAA